MIIKFKIFEENNNNQEFNIGDLVKYKYSHDEIYQIYRIHEDRSRLGYKVGYIRDIITKNQNGKYLIN